MFVNLFNLLALFADDPAAGGGPKAPGGSPDPFGGFGMLIPMLLILVVFYFLLMRPMRKQEQERKALAEQLSKNDKVLTASGIIGTVASVPEAGEEEVVVKIDDNTRVRMLKSSIVRNYTKEEAAKVAREQKEAAK